ncbi:MAG TPA: TolC family outer membrane protein [Methylophilaceae bacterium]|jgi:adhesin transport system outer membrane protein
MNLIYKSLIQAGLILATLPSYAGDVTSSATNGSIASTTVAPAGGLQAIITKVVSSNPEVQAKYHAFKASAYEQGVARGGFFPKVDAIGTLRAQEELTPNVNNTQTPDAQAQLVIKQMLFDGFGTSAEVKRLDRASRVRYFELLSAMQSAALETTTTYNDLIRYRQSVKYAQENYTVHKQLTERIKDRVSAGVGRRVDMDQASGRLALAEANLLTESTSLQNATAKYQRLVGELPPSVLTDPDYYKDGVDETATKALTTAYQKNPDLIAALENIEAGKHEIDNRRAKYYPRADAQGTANLGVSDNGKNSTLAADNASLIVSMNLFNGWSDRSAIEQSKQKLNSAEDLKNKVCLDTRQILTIAYNDTQQLPGQLSYRNQHQTSIAKARDAYQKQYDIGQRTLLDLLDTENEYFQARKAYTNTEQDLHNAYARTYAAEGELLQKIGATRSDLPEIDTDTSTKCASMEVAEQPAIDKDALAGPKAATAPLPVVPLVDGSKLKAVETKTLPSVQFEVNSSTLTTSSFAELDQALPTLKEWLLDSQVEVAGHTDKRNTSKMAYNMKLSQNRAEAVRQYFISKGINGSRLNAVGYGYTKPVAPNDPITGSDLNRRVEIIRMK